MSKEIILEEEILERKAHKDLSQKIREKYSLEKRLPIPGMEDINIDTEEIRRELERTTLECIET